MSKPPPSAFDALMSCARAAAKKPPPPPPLPPPSSPKKRKSPHSSPAQKSNGLRTPETVQQSNKAQELPHKIIVSSSSKEMIAELKERLPWLKDKPLEFDLGSVTCWDKDQLVPFLFLCLAFDMIVKETRRIVIQHCVQPVKGRDTHYASGPHAGHLLSANRITPTHEGLEWRIGDASIIKVLGCLLRL